MITQKPVVKKIMDDGLQACGHDIETLVQHLHVSLLKEKVRFPLLEYAGKYLSVLLKEEEQDKFMDGVVALNETGSYVLAGIILQQQLTKGIEKPVQKACAYITFGNVWYVCDIVGERVLGHALLTQPGTTLPLLKKLSIHENKWLVRSVGVAGHYAIKNGLPARYADELFLLLFLLAGVTDFHTKKGIGWAVKTLAKFHPAIIEKYRQEMDQQPELKQWFKTKIKIGLSRKDKYAGRYA